MKKILGVILVILFLAAIPATVFLVAQRQELRKRAAPATTLSISPATITKAVGETFTLEVKIDTATNQVIAAEIVLTFDPEKLEAQSITNGSHFPNILTSGVVDRGTTSISVGAASSAQPVVGTGTAAVIRFKALASTADTPVTIRFAQNTFVGGLGESGKNILIGTNPGRVTITGTATSGSGQTGTGNATPTPTPGTGGSFGNEQVATSSAVKITSPVNNASVSTDTPTLTGKAPAGSTVTITIYSTPMTATVTADANGNWTYTPAQPLEEGPHNVVVSVVASGQTQTASSSFVVASGTELGATQSATPVAGNAQTTLLLVLLGSSLIAFGTLLPHLAKAQQTKR